MERCVRRLCVDYMKAFENVHDSLARALTDRQTDE